MHLVAEWISLTEMKVLQSSCTLVSMKAREKEYEEFLSSQDGQVWKEMSEESRQYLKEKEESPAVSSRHEPMMTFNTAESGWDVY